MEHPLGASAADIPAAVRRRCAEVAADARWVQLDEARVHAFAELLIDEGVVATSRAGGGDDQDAPDGDDPWAIADHDAGGSPEADESRAALVLALSAVNFGSGYHPVVRKRPDLSGARTMAAAMRDWAASAPIDATRLAHLTPAHATEIFDQADGDEAVDELMVLFAAALNDLGNLVLDEFDGSFVTMVAAADDRAVHLVGILDQLPFFRDTAPYRGRIVPFYKRAQLAAADLHRAFGGRAPAAFVDLASLTAFADNLVPHVLRVDGVLRYDAGLVARIDAGELLPPGCEEEVEIRAVGVHAVERLTVALTEHGVDTRPCDLDPLLWWRGRGPRYKSVPRHRTRTTAY